ncbi:hypothetical protein Psi01_84950 [Planobispora siamensis]|uniref:Uncharacterized protein n=1 Tax=Planobispora siamensis TaxID=936338 RepID=A0A8J3WQB1_9ACTN|nr:hypothetical protein Psi01_84950 [Planobispora siamensis]
MPADSPLPPEEAAGWWRDPFTAPPLTLSDPGPGTNASGPVNDQRDFDEPEFYGQSWTPTRWQRITTFVSSHLIPVTAGAVLLAAAGIGIWTALPASEAETASPRSASSPTPRHSVTSEPADTGRPYLAYPTAGPSSWTPTPTPKATPTSSPSAKTPPQEPGGREGTVHAVPLAEPYRPPHISQPAPPRRSSPSVRSTKSSTSRSESRPASRPRTDSRPRTSRRDSQHQSPARPPTAGNLPAAAHAQCDRLFAATDFRRGACHAYLHSQGY